MCDEIRNENISEESKDKAADKAFFEGAIAEKNVIEISVNGSPEELLALLSAMVHFYAKRFNADVASLLLVINEGIKTVFEPKTETNEVQHTGDGV